MQQLLIIKTGSSAPTLDPSYGDFEDWISEHFNGSDLSVRVSRVDLGAELPEVSEIAGAIVTGSAAMVTERLEWSERTATWLAAAVQAKLPILGICYGHQLLAHGLGGSVDHNPNGREIGTVTVRLTDAALSDPLLRQLPSEIDVQETHVESVAELPAGSILLATSDRDPHQAFRIGANAWGLQFHPEFTAKIIRGYLEARREIIIGEGIDVDQLIEETRDTNFGGEILRRFVEIVQEHAPD
ncbi:MAG: glutamine amidotransferase [bacterium]|nr:glutamine amidotransferase [bacterium]